MQERIGIDIDALIELLYNSNIALDAMEIADILWLTRYYQYDKKPLYRYHEADATPPPLQERSIQNPPSHSEPNPPTPPPKEKKNEDNGYDRENRLELSNKSHKESIDIARPSYFDNASYISKYLLHFRDKVPSRRRFDFDEVRSVEYYAQTRLAYPFFKPQKTKRFRLYCIIDNSDKMKIWQELMDEYISILKNAIVFKDIEIIYYNSDNDKWSRDKQGHRGFDYKSISNYYNEKLIFVLSDMMGKAWYDGGVLETLYTLNQTIPLFMIQMLPYRKWRTTRLAKASITSLDTLYPYPLAHSYQSGIDDMFGDEEMGEAKASLPRLFKLPLVYCELEYLPVIGACLQGLPNNQIDGAVIELSKSSPPSLHTLSPQEQIKYFFATSSVEARELLIKFATLPLNLAIMKMVLGNQKNIYLAEVLNSGLLHKKGELYHFENEVQERLLRYMGKKERLEILYSNSDYIQKALGTKFSFKALLAGEADLEELQNEEWDEGSELFAFIACKTLKSLGGEYAKRAGCYKPPPPPPPPPPSSPQPNPSSWVQTKEIMKNLSTRSLSTMILR